MCRCDLIFDKFTWKDLVAVNSNELPPDQGVYAIRVRKRKEPIDQVISDAYSRFFGDVDWSTSLRNFVSSRFQRLKEIGECPIIYIGAARKSLRGRFIDLCGKRHTAFFSIWALLRADWKLDYGWLRVVESLEKEKSLKQQYSEIHQAPPALVKR